MSIYFEVGVVFDVIVSPRKLKNCYREVKIQKGVTYSYMISEQQYEELKYEASLLRRVYTIKPEYLEILKLPQNINTYNVLMFYSIKR